MIVSGSGSPAAAVVVAAAFGIFDELGPETRATAALGIYTDTSALLHAATPLDFRMFEKLKKASDPKSKTYLDPVQTEKHIFDALSYVICMYLLDEMTFGHDSGPLIRRRVRV